MIIRPAYDLLGRDEVGSQSSYNDGHHVHTIGREKGNEFGEDVLRKHYFQQKH